MVAPLALAVGAGLLLPVGLATWDVPGSALGLIAASAAFEVAYFALLARAYAVGSLGFVYPVARGSAPLIALAVTVAFLGASLSALSVAGVVLVAVGIVLVRGVSASGPLLLAVGVGACIAGYTVVDDEALGAGAGAVSYLACVLALSAVSWLGAIAWSTARRGQTMRSWVARGGVSPVRVVFAGVGMVVAYLLVLWALDRAEAAPVAAVRETSVLFAVGFAALVARERVTAARAAGAGLIVAGVGALALA